MMPPRLTAIPTSTMIRRADVLEDTLTLKTLIRKPNNVTIIPAIAISIISSVEILPDV